MKEFLTLCRPWAGNLVGYDTNLAEFKLPANCAQQTSLAWCGGLCGSVWWERRQMLGCAGGGATASGLRRLAVPFLCIGPAAVAPSRLPDAVLVGSRSASATTRITSSRCLIPRAHLGSGTVDKTCIRLDWRPATHRRPGLVRAEQ